MPVPLPYSFPTQSNTTYPTHTFSFLFLSHLCSISDTPSTPLSVVLLPLPYIILLPLNSFPIFLFRSHTSIGLLISFSYIINILYSTLRISLPPTPFQSNAPLFVTPSYTPYPDRPMPAA